MRQIPVDTDRLNLIGTGKVAGKPQYAQLSTARGGPGTRR